MAIRTTLVDVNRKAFSLKVFRSSFFSSQFDLLKEYSISVGMEGYKTPTGVYWLSHKAKCPDWLVPDEFWALEMGLVPGTIVPGCTTENPLKLRWVGITDPSGGIGIHGTSNRDSIGTRASHGCIRMLEEDVVEFYELVRKGTPIVITDG